jgi:hypothetical protein
VHAPSSGVRRSGGASRQTPEEADEGYQSTKGGILGRVFKENVDLRRIRELLRHKDCYISENSCGTKKVGLSQDDIEFLGLVLQKAEAEDNPGLHVVSTQYKTSKSGEVYATNKASLGRASKTESRGCTGYASRRVFHLAPLPEAGSSGVGRKFK